MSQPYVSVIIPTYNRLTILAKALNALAKQRTARPYEVVVVDDGSTDETPHVIPEMSFEGGELRYLRVSHGGPAGARNVGIEAARGELIIFLDSDIVVEDGFIEAHCQAHEGHPKRIGHGPVIHTDDIENPTAAQFKLTDISRAFFATGNASIRREHLIEAGLFDESFREYGWEDLEFGLRLKRFGLKAVQVPEARGYHYKARLQLSQLEGLIARERSRARTAVIFFEKHPVRSVRMTTWITPSMMWIGRLLFAGGWPDWPSFRRWLTRLEEKGRHTMLRAGVRMVTLHAYFDELRRELRKRASHPTTREGSGAGGPQ